MSLLRALLATSLFAAFALLSACGPGGSSNGGCSTNAECTGGNRCAANGQCVACTSNDHCGDDQFCCQGACYDADAMEQRCGCAPNPGVSPAGGESCSPGEVCVAGNARATVETVTSGTCDCSCSASQGGTLCTPDPDGPEGYKCSCERTDPTTCETPVVDSDGVPHGVADTCTPLNACVCFAAGQTCDPNGATPDCTVDGCANLFGDDQNCGVAGRDCTDPTTGTGDDGRCIAGGCSCDALADCQGSGLNVDSCVILAGGGQCVCSGYMISGALGACPLGLACTAQGCLLDGTAYPTATQLYEALGIPPGTVE